ncbi:hypothetical protein KKC22_00685 [Myxococcota bacterium]|nr:hypothetical protein [Myxococcota bacterium]
MAEERLINKGRTVTVSDLLAQCNVSEGAARAFEVELAECGWPLPRTVLMEDLTGELKNLAGSSEAQIEDAKHLPRKEVEARQGAKALLRKIQEGLKIIHREGLLGDLTLDSFSREGKLLQSTADLAAYLLRVEPLIARLDSQLSRFFGGRQPSELVREAVTELQEADRAQELARQELPAKTLERLELKGRLLDLIDELNGVARIAFDGQAEKRARFNKDMLLRARRGGTADGRGGTADRRGGTAESPPHPAAPAGDPPTA